MEEIGQRLADRAADILDADMLGDRLVELGRGASPRSRRCGGVASRSAMISSAPGAPASCIALQQVARGDRADMADAEAEQQPRRIGRRLASIAASRLSTDFSCQPSRPTQVASRCAARRKMSAGPSASQPRSRNSASVFSPSPSMSSAPRLTKCLQPLEPLRRADQPAGAADVDFAFLGDRLDCRRSGQWSGNDVRPARSSSRVRFSTICGITSPARWSTTRSPGRRPRRAISSRLCSVDVGHHRRRRPVTGGQPAHRRQLAGAADLDVDSPRAWSRRARRGICAPSPQRGALGRRSRAAACQSSRSTL